MTFFTGRITIHTSALDEGDLQCMALPGSIDPFTTSKKTISEQNSSLLCGNFMEIAVLESSVTMTLSH